MKKLWLALFPIILCPSLSACQDKEHSITPIHVIGEDTKGLSITSQEFEYLYRSGQEFAVEFYSPYCSHCEELNPKLEKYMSETKNLIYRFDLTKFDSTEEKNEFIARYSNVIVDEYVPAIRFVKNGQLTYEVESTKFDSYTKLRQTLNGHFLSSHINISSSKKTMDEYTKNKSTYLVYAYDMLSLSSVKYASNYIINQSFAKKEMPVLLLNCKDFDSSEYNLIKSNYGIQYDTFVAKIENNELTKIADFSANDFDYTEFF